MGGQPEAVPGEIARVSDISKLGSALVGIGAGGVLVFGVILAFEADSYAIWDAWIVFALILWFLFAEVGRRYSGPRNSQHSSVVPVRSFDSYSVSICEKTPSSRLECTRVPIR